MNKEIDKVAKENALFELNNFKPTKEKFKLSNKNSFIKGAKWQQERMYSEEEVIDLINLRTFDLDLAYSKKPIYYLKTKEWFERFKKK